MRASYSVRSEGRDIDERWREGREWMGGEGVRQLVGRGEWETIPMRWNHTYSCIPQLVSFSATNW